MEVILHFPHELSLEEDGVREPKERAHSVEHARAGGANKGQHSSGQLRSREQEWERWENSMDGISGRRGDSHLHT